MAVDNTHTKYLKGADKKAWNDYKLAYESQQKLDSFMASLGVKDDLEDGEEIDIPVIKNKKKK